VARPVRPRPPHGLSGGGVLGCCQFVDQDGHGIHCEWTTASDCSRYKTKHFYQDRVCDRRGKVCIKPSPTPTPTSTRTPTATVTCTPPCGTPVCIEVHGKGGAGTEPCENRPNLRCDGTDAGRFQIEASCIPPFTLQKCLNKKTGGNGDGDWARVLPDYEGAGGCMCEGRHAEKEDLFAIGDHWGAGHWSWCTMDAQCCVP